MRDYRSHRSHLLEHNPRPWARVEIARCIAPVGDRRKRRYIIEAHEPRGVAQSGSASGLGPEGPGFKSRRPDFPHRCCPTPFPAGPHSTPQGAPATPRMPEPISPGSDTPYLSRRLPQEGDYGSASPLSRDCASGLLPRRRWCQVFAARSGLSRAGGVGPSYVEDRVAGC